MKTTMSTKAYAMAACDTLMRTFSAAELPPKGHFHYHQGVFLSGMYQTYLVTQEETYFTYLKAWVDSIIDEHGDFDWFNPHELDDIQPGILLFPLWERTKEEKYKKALETLMTALEKTPKNKEGGFWHKDRYQNQMWLDGLYMAGPIAVEYALTFNEPKFQRQALAQTVLMEEMTKDPQSGLWSHAYDSLKEEEWADPVTGRSPEFWGRAFGWVAVAILEELELLAKFEQTSPVLEKMIQEILQTILVYQAAEGRWYQVIDKGEHPDNWLENSASCLFITALYKGIMLGLLDETNASHALRGYEGVVKSCEWDGDDLLIGNVSIGTGVGDYAHYINRPVSENDLHGVGAFLLMCAAKANFEEQEK